MLIYNYVRKSELKYIYSMIFFYFLNPCLGVCFLILGRESGGRKRERNRNISVTEKHQLVVSPDWGSNP